MGLISDRKSKSKREKELAILTSKAAYHLQQQQQHGQLQYQAQLGGSQHHLNHIPPHPPHHHHPYQPPFHHHHHPGGPPPQHHHQYNYHPGPPQPHHGGGGGSGGKKKRGVYGPQVLPTGGGPMAPGPNGKYPQKYPAGYYTTPVHSSRGSNHEQKEMMLKQDHPGQPKPNPNVNPRYQTWVAPRKQPSLGQLVRQRTPNRKRGSGKKRETLDCHRPTDDLIV